MRRSVFGLVAIAAAFWVWRNWSSNDAAAATTESLAHVATAAEPEVPRREAVQSGAREEPSREAATPEAALCAAVVRREPGALAVGYRRLLDLEDGARDSLAAALRRAAGDDLEAMLSALGDGNGFLHSDAGRAAGREAVRRATQEKGDGGPVAFTAILERCMRGRIEPTDVEARRFVDETYAAMQPALNRTLFNPENVAASRTHKVLKGESLDRIAASYRKQGLVLDGLTIALFNRITDPTKLRADQILKIPVAPISTVIEKRSYLMAMYLGDSIFRLFWVGHGKDDRTPETTFTVTLKQEHPDWHVDGRIIPYGHPDNILGDYFVKFEHASFQGYGAHGTPAPETIGTMSSAGCIRMRDSDIRDFFRIVPRGSPVHIRATETAGSR